MKMNRILALAISLLVATSAQADCGQDCALVSTDDYASAERFLAWNAEKYVLNGAVQHHWIDDGDTFWYARETPAGKRYEVIDAVSGRRWDAFNHNKLAKSLSEVTSARIDGAELDLKSFTPSNGGSAELFADEKRWVCNLSAWGCKEKEEAKLTPGELRSPDGKWAIFVRDNDLYLRSTSDGSERRLTSDGTAHYSYGKLADSNTVVVSLRRQGFSAPPVAIWSPDSKRFVTHRLDEREVKDLHLLQYTPEDDDVRPKLFSYRYAFPGDENITKSELIIFDVEDGAGKSVKLPQLDVLFFSPLAFGRVWWSGDNSKLYVVPTELQAKKLRLIEIDASTGEADTLVEEQGKTYVEASPNLMEMNLRVLSTGEIIWYSERDDWGHLYLYNKEGKFTNRITKGDWQVHQIIHIDEASRRIFFTAGGREAGDPYYNRLYSVGLDGRGLKLLSPEDANHELSLSARGFAAKVFNPEALGPEEAAFSASGDYFVETYSRPDMPPVTLVRTKNGEIVTEVVKADITALEAGGFIPPEPFSVLAADGRTKLFGNIFRPSAFDADKTYPVLDSNYPGPQVIRTQKSFMSAIFDPMEAQSLADLGFIVVTIDGRGTPGRSKSFHDASYGDLGQAGNLEDHIAGLKQLAKRYPYMDLSRVGIYGHSGGGFAAARAMLDFPDFFKVAVASSGNHDQRGYVLIWGPTYQGPFSPEAYENVVTPRLAANLNGKLLLVHGGMDDNVHPAHTMQLVEALIAANKDFDLLILPNASHSYDGKAQTYFIRRRWDYFVKNLKNSRVPAFEVSGPGH